MVAADPEKRLEAVLRLAAMLEAEGASLGRAGGAFRASWGWVIWLTSLGARKGGGYHLGCSTEEMLPGILKGGRAS